MSRTPVALALLALAAPLGAQQGAFGRAEARQPAWLGISYDIRWIQRGDACQPQVLVEAVVPGSPAERAGLRPGDAIIHLAGSTNPASRLPALAGHLAPGDSVRMSVARDGAVHELVAVADRRPAQPPALRAAPAPGLLRSTAPVVQLRGDTLVAHNLGMSRHLAGFGGGYWMVRDNGRAEFRRLSSWSEDDVDRRFTDLMACADSAQWTAEAPAVARLDLEGIRARADSLRVVLAQRALAPLDEGRRMAVFRELTEQARDAAPGIRDAGPEPPTAFTYWLGEHLAAGQRSVAGAELSPLEPELAEYFQGVRDGLLVLRVAEGSPAERAGLRPGDVITGGDDRRLTSIPELRSLLATTGPRPVELRVVRRGRDRLLTLRRE